MQMTKFITKALCFLFICTPIVLSADLELDQKLLTHLQESKGVKSKKKDDKTIYSVHGTAEEQSKPTPGQEDFKQYLDEWKDTQKGSPEKRRHEAEVQAERAWGKPESQKV